VKIYTDCRKGRCVDYIITNGSAALNVGAKEVRNASYTLVLGILFFYKEIRPSGDSYIDGKIGG
jgi:hypothetical protein